MGVHSMISHAISKMKKGDTTNSRTLGKWTGRVTRIAQDLETSNDIAKQQKLQTVVYNIAERLARTEANQPEGVTSHFSPRIYQERKEILSEADKTLDTIQPPPKGYPEEMQKAMSNDERELGSTLKGLSQANNELLKEMSQRVLVTEPTEERKMCRKISPENLESQGPASTSSWTHALWCEEKAYEQFKQKMAQFEQGIIEPSIIIGISEMGSENGKPIAQIIPHDHTFCALADSFTDFKSESFLPDFWVKEVDPSRNCITKSGVWWEWQDPSKKVIDVIQKTGHKRIETVRKKEEYVVALVKKGEVENGMPIEIPRTYRQCAFLHLQQHFPNHIVRQVRKLQEGEDAREVPFDNRYFPHKTNTLFVELELGTESTEPTSVVVRAGGRHGPN